MGMEYSINNTVINIINRYCSNDINTDIMYNITYKYTNCIDDN